MQKIITIFAKNRSISIQTKRKKNYFFGGKYETVCRRQPVKRPRLTDWLAGWTWETKEMKNK
jgi:hypothetical protein